MAAGETLRPRVRSRRPTGSGSYPRPAAPAAEAGSSDEPASRVVLEERARVARELHDGPVQTLWYLSLETHRLVGLLSELRGELAENGRPAETLALVLERVRGIQETLAQAHAEARLAISALRRPSPTPDFAADLGGLVAESERSGVAVHLACELAGADFSPRERTELLCVLREALANVRRHSGAREARVWVGRRCGCRELLVADGGAGFDVCGRPEPGHYGLLGMRERVASLGGVLDVESAPGCGTTVRITLPDLLSGPGANDEETQEHGHQTATGSPG